MQRELTGCEEGVRIARGEETDTIHKLHYCRRINIEG